MSTSIFNLEFSAGDECYAVLTGLDRSKMAAQLDSEQMSEFANRFDELRRKVVDGSVTLERNEMFEGLNDHYILDTLINWLDVVIEEDVVDGGVSHPKAVVDEAVMALKRLRDGEKSVTMCKGATWEIQECAELVEQVEHDNLKAARSVFERAKGQLPPNACWHGVEGHSGLT
jgi:hypothetical protein